VTWKKLVVVNKFAVESIARLVAMKKILVAEQ
jgi:hypothetical protein